MWSAKDSPPSRSWCLLPPKIQPQLEAVGCTPSHHLEITAMLNTKNINYHNLFLLIYCYSSLLYLYELTNQKYEFSIINFPFTPLQC